MTTFQDVLAAEIAAYASPTQLYDLDRIGRTIRMLGDGLGDPGRVLMALKSFPSPTVAAAARAAGAGFEVSSPLEYALLPDDLSGAIVALTAPAPSALEQYLTRGNVLHVHLDDASLVAALPVPAGTRLGLRVSPSTLGTGTDGLVDGRPSRFGVSLAELRASAPRYRDGRLQGVHLHDGSEANTPDTYRSALERLLDVARSIGRPFGFIDLGGGLHTIPDATLVALLAELTAAAGDTPVLVEPGRILGRRAGYLLTRVIAIREVVPREWRVTVDASYQCHARWQHLAWHGAAPGTEPLPFDHAASAGPGRNVLRFVGASCVELDVLGVHALPDGAGVPVAVGDVVVFGNLDGYAYAWNRSFNGVPEARVRFA